MLKRGKTILLSLYFLFSLSVLSKNIHPIQNKCLIIPSTDLFKACIEVSGLLVFHVRLKALEKYGFPFKSQSKEGLLAPGRTLMLLTLTYPARYR